MSQEFYKQKSGPLSLDDLADFNEALKGIKSFNLADPGEFAFVAPTQIVSAPAGSKALDEYGKISEYKGLPEIIMAEDFVGIPVWLEKDYHNYQQPRRVYQNVFDYDLNLHLIDNILRFRKKIKDEAYFKGLDEEVQNQIKSGKLFSKEGEDEYILVPESSLVNDKRTKGLIIEHMDLYKTDVIFFTKPVIGVRLSPTDKYFQSYALEKTIKTEEEAKLYNIPIGYTFKTKLGQGASLYLWAFSQRHEKKVYDKYPEMKPADVRKTSEFTALEDIKLIQKTKYRVLTLINRIPLNKRKDIEVESGSNIPSFLGRMSVSSGMFSNIFEVDKVSKANYEPSFRFMVAEVPKPESQSRAHIGQQYMDMKFTEPGMVGADIAESDSNPFIHSVDKEYSKRVKESSLNFKFKEAFVAQNTSTLGKDLTQAELNEILRQILVPTYHEIKESGEYEDIESALKNFITDDLGLTPEQLKNKQLGHEENLKDAQFSGLSQGARTLPRSSEVTPQE